MDTHVVEFKIDAISNLNRSILITDKIKLIKIDKKNGSFTVALHANADSEQEAVEICRRTLNEFLDYYYAVTGAYVHISEDGDPSSVAQLTGKAWVSVPINLKIPLIFIYNRKYRKSISKNLDDLSKKEYKYLRIAMDYNRRAKFEIVPENRLILYFIALEALYSKDNEKTEIAYRFSNRISVLLGKDSKHRISLLNESKELYNLRSRIVHGDQNKIDKSILEKVESWVEETILRFFTLHKKYPSQKDVIEAIDNSIIDEKTRIKIKNLSDPAVKHLNLQQIRKKKTP